ncbi:MAG TPA: MTH938/NDUFAF3 family protein [Rubrobacter sp.]|nr:MTH938/NDUFAF3 family protein [Rubrobacter sp.]
MMNRRTYSPRITRLSWGRLETDSGVFKDVRLYPGGAEEWDWNETGTNHDPGIQPADVERLLERGSTVVILSRGFHERLGVAPETLRMLEEREIPAHVVQTEEAARLYEALRETEKVGALIHSTC